MNILFASTSELGPRSVNEDFIDCWNTDSGGVVACVADGLGGMGGGDAASKLAVEKFKSYLQTHGVDEEKMRTAALSAHKAILNEQMKSKSSRMATTLTAVFIYKDELVGVHCGDSRAVIARGKGIKRLTKDHSEGQRLFDAGKLTKQEFFNYPRKHILESALGHHDEPRIDSVHFDVLPGDRVILTTDGMHNVILLKEMKYLCDISSSPENLVKNAIDSVRISKVNDNYSMIALFAE
ncbi:MAG: PP2C family protein-serine/threonine phosphatase [Pseudomonadota bacterium]